MSAPELAWLRPLVDLALAISLLELLWLLSGAGRRHGLRPQRLPLLANLGSGLLLMLALRLALGGSAAWAIALCLAASGLAHGLDLRLRHPPPPERPT